MANSTKVILNQTVAKLGVAGDVVEVKGGFARNFLLPRAIAAPWSKAAEEQIKLRKEASRRKAVENAEKAGELKAKLEAAPLVVAVKAGKEGKLFGAVKNQQIVDAAKANLGVELDKRSIEIEGTVKILGAAKATVHLLDSVSAELKITVVSAGSK